MLCDSKETSLVVESDDMSFTSMSTLAQDFDGERGKTCLEVALQG